MAHLRYFPVDDGPGPIVADHHDTDDYVIYGVYGMVPLHPRARGYVRGREHGYAHAFFKWSQATPYEFTLTLTQRNGRNIDWVVARELLRSGGGEGDIHVEQDGGEIVVGLSSPSGEVAFVLEAIWVEDLLNATHEIVPADEEWNSVRLPDSGSFW